MTSSICPGSTPVRSSSDLIACAPRSAPCTPARLPFFLPVGVRTAPTMEASLPINGSLLCRALALGGRVTRLVRGGTQVHLECEALLEAVTVIDIARLESVQRLLGKHQRPAALRGDERRKRARLLQQTPGRTRPRYRSQPISFGRVDAAAGKESRAHHVQRNHAREVRSASHGAAVDL